MINRLATPQRLSLSLALDSRLSTLDSPQAPLTITLSPPKRVERGQDKTQTPRPEQTPLPESSARSTCCTKTLKVAGTFSTTRPTTSPPIHPTNNFWRTTNCNSESTPTRSSCGSKNHRARCRSSCSGPRFAESLSLGHRFGASSFAPELPVRLRVSADPNDFLIRMKCRIEA